ncbi:ankyrin [Thozetella sp. PMI_491]|nr:ankyrin [Thozetella sp. PMI_491]
MLERGANVDPSSDEVETAVQFATRRGDIMLVECLLDNGASINAAGGPKRTPPLNIASAIGNLDMVKMLLSRGARVDLHSGANYGATALHYAAMGGFLSIAEVLIQHGAGVNTHASRFQGATALVGAAAWGRIDMVQYLLNIGAAVREDSQFQFQLAAQEASRNGHHVVRKLLETWYANTSSGT